MLMLIKAESSQVQEDFLPLPKSVLGKDELNYNRSYRVSCGKVVQ